MVYRILLAQDLSKKQIESILNELKLISYFTFEEFDIILKKVRLYIFFNNSLESQSLIKFRYDFFFNKMAVIDINLSIAVFKAILNDYSLCNINFLVETLWKFGARGPCREYELTKFGDVSKSQKISQIYSDLMNYHSYDINKLPLDDRIKEDITISGKLTKPAINKN
jgi:uncharacterized Fe-S cluster-containing MiaB family protein